MIYLISIIAGKLESQLNPWVRQPEVSIEHLSKEEAGTTGAIKEAFTETELSK